MERAWIEHVLTLDRPVFGLARIRRATVLLDRKGLAVVTRSPPAGEVRFLDRIRGRGSSLRAKAEAGALRAATASWSAVPDVAELHRHVGPGPRYLAVGHTGLDARCLGAMAAIPGARSAVLVHDTIPLDFPETQKPGTADRFREKLDWVARAADLVAVPTEATLSEVRRHLDMRGFEGQLVAARPGVAPLVPGAFPPAVPRDRPYFVAVGTIEPRKNHALLLDLWEQFGTGPDTPRLVIAGRRGWRNHAVFRRLDALRGSETVIEVNDLGDGALAALVDGALGLLFPSLAEGFGYPPLEAVSLGTPVVASPLPQIRELLGASVVYADPADLYQWREAVGDLVAGEKVVKGPVLPTWRDHFNTVLSSLG